MTASYCMLEEFYDYYWLRTFTNADSGSIDFKICKSNEKPCLYLIFLQLL